jgi:hypothetical protein
MPEGPVMTTTTPLVTKRPTLRELVVLFLKLGAIGFGGGMAVLALMEHELIQRHKLMEPEEFLHGVALGQVLGPFAVNASLFVGNRYFGFPCRSHYFIRRNQVVWAKSMSNSEVDRVRRRDQRDKAAYIKEVNRAKEVAPPGSKAQGEMEGKPSAFMSLLRAFFLGQ